MSGRHRLNENAAPLIFGRVSHFERKIALTDMRILGNVLRALSIPLAIVPVAACGGSDGVLQSLDAGSGGTSGDAHVDANLDTPDAATSEDAGADAAGSSGDADAGIDASHVCGDLPDRDLNSIADVKAALLASPAFPFPGGWQPCMATILVCPMSAPALSFDQDLTTLRCGGNFESGFNTVISYPMTVVDTGVKGSYALRVESDAGIKSYILVAQGQIGAAVGFKLLEPDVTKTQWVTFEPLIPLP